MASNNPGNFANRPKEEVREIAAKGGHASHGGGRSGGNGDSHNDSSAGGQPGRNPDGTFTKGSQVASELGAIGGHHSHGGGNASNHNDDSGFGGTSGGASHPGRNPDGTFTKGSEEASRLGHIGGSK
ncbi:uncharacterized protein EI97DRAFT_456852 [Westerdykella ornata]|uniref:Conidiation-specific protein 10 n=1 Tax=Westerdykella ornata TaxID=318751 RepID=A0A6A6JPZ9_WESOR|nr:uncharacterized protein EI97DRAFT_456852 [Westerdykella ornata]KAF2278457.1 hypothetical protein EI97DRAFT_456852 [Westerdykella ornata]